MSDARLLLVDDDPGSIEDLSSILSSYHDQSTASSGLDALRLALTWVPDLVLLSADMRDMSSFDVCREMKADPALAEVPIIFITSRNDPSVEAMAVKAGAADCISKPMQPDLLKARVSTQLKVRELTESLRLLATLDNATGIANRRVFDDTLRTEWQRCRRSGQELSLMMVDVDHFKAYNDRYGHQAGDQCLRQVARTLQGVSKRPADLPARFGGDEFVMVLPDTDAEGALVVAQSLMTAMYRLGLPHGALGESRFVTLSVGLCTYDAGRHRAHDGVDSRFASEDSRSLRVSDLLQAAEAALRRAKEAGGCQIWSMDMEDAAHANTPLLCRTPPPLGGGESN